MVGPAARCHPHNERRIVVLILYLVWKPMRKGFYVSSQPIMTKSREIIIYDNIQQYWPLQNCPVRIKGCND